jgi:CheY-like chemotaxis protein
MKPQTKTILHVEDDPSLQKLVRTALERLGGYTVQTAADGFDAVLRAGASAPDLVLLDLDLPGMDGLSTLATLHKLEGLHDLPAVFLTASSDPEVRERLLRAGASAVVGKPFRPRELMQVVERVLAEGR